MKKILSLIALICMSQLSIAQTTDAEKDLKNSAIDTIQGWKKGGSFMLNFSQVSLTNWNAGGLNSFSLNGGANFYAHYTKGKGQWENTLDLGYGILRQGRKGNVAWLKTDDKIDLFSKFGRKASKSWFYSALLNFKTQATDGFSYPNDSVAISKFMAPGYLLAGAGMDYKPNKIFSAFIAPLTLKTTFVLDDTLAAARSFGLDPLETGKVRTEVGGYVRLQLVLENADADRKAFQNISFISKLDLFTNYLQNPDRIDVNWENILQLKVNQYISASLTTQLIYDDDIDISVFNNDGVEVGKGPRVQFKEVLGIGLTYNFKSPK